MTNALRSWSTAFKNRPKPTYGMVDNLIQKFEATGKLTDDIGMREIGGHTSVSPEIADRIEEMIIAKLTISTRKLAQAAGVSQSSVYRVLRKDLSKFPYKVQMAQRITADIKVRRFNFATDVLQMIDTKAIDPNKIIFSDEAHFWGDGYESVRSVHNDCKSPIVKIENHETVVSDLHGQYSVFVGYITEFGCLNGVLVSIDARLS